jgi:DNA-directed RNA polymerase specialized sigma24 family protein
VSEDLAAARRTLAAKPTAGAVLDQVYRTHRPRLLRFVEGMARASGLAEAQLDAEGVVQETFEALLMAWDSVAEPHRWIYVVAANKVSRQAGAGRRSELRLRQFLRAKPVSCDPVFVRVLANTMVDRIMELPTNQRIATYLRHVLGWSGPEIADLLDIEATTVNVHVWRGIHRVTDNETLGDALTLMAAEYGGYELACSHAELRTHKLSDMANLGELAVWRALALEASSTVVRQGLWQRFVRWLRRRRIVWWR